MNLYYFDQITKDHSHLGGKGYTLGLMKNAGFPVPDGLILTTLPENEDQWSTIFEWWEKNQCPMLAIRSSAIGEDSSEQSFAGQNSTYLNIDNKNAIKVAIKNCFLSIHRASSALYREHFLKNQTTDAKMNVVLQVMVAPLYSGVFFSVDPRTNESGWIAEAIEGLGEDLVSGRKTPHHFEEKIRSTTKLFDLDELVKTGMAIRDFFNTEIDIEWAIDQDKKLKILQARPITALAGKSAEKRFLDEEIQRIKNHNPKDSLWDGGTFAEWSGPPTELTFSIWQEAFRKDRAFSKALQKLGYMGIDHELPNEAHSLLERIFNRAYVNISMLAPLYFGPIPYRLIYRQSPKLKFDLKKMTLKAVLLTPITMWRMLKVGWGLSTSRHEWLNECKNELITFTQKSFRAKDSGFYKNFSDDKIIETFKNEIEDFYSRHLFWPLTLITLIESTTQNIKVLLNGVLSEEEIKSKLNSWMGSGLHTVTMKMNNDYKSASQEPSKQAQFLEQYGHRGPGELELSHPRWSELKETAFHKLSNRSTTSSPKQNQMNVTDDILTLKTYKKEVIAKEWSLLQEMLELREMWKMQLLSPYSHIRFLALELALRHQLGDSIFWFNYQEIIDRKFDLRIANKRKSQAELSKSIYLPTILELSKLEDILSSKTDTNINSITGLALSSGIAYGEVRIVTDPEQTNSADWPDNTILVAESTDPGWTGLFLKSKAVIVEKGGVLSHCAIVAREMGLPAVSGIKQCHLRLKDGDKIWVDGNHGRITLASSQS